MGEGPTSLPAGPLSPPSSPKTWRQGVGRGLSLRSPLPRFFRLLLRETWDIAKTPAVGSLGPFVGCPCPGEDPVPREEVRDYLGALSVL